MLRFFIFIFVVSLLIPHHLVYARNQNGHLHHGKPHHHKQKKRTLRQHDAILSQPLNLLPLQHFPDQQNQVSIMTRGDQRIIESNGIPNHKIGKFPNRGNPHAIQPQNHQFYMALTPIKNPSITVKKGWFWGVAINGVPFEGSTGEFWQGKKHAYDGKDGWNYDALGGAIKLGLDAQHAHIQKGGAYHYHALPIDLWDQLQQNTNMPSPLIGWAADGFPIYALKANFNKNKGIESAKSSYRLKKGQRHHVSGRHDGAFVQDYEYIAGLGNLDECNGAFIISKEFPKGSYAYFITDSFPYIPRCWYGTPNASFGKKTKQKR